STIRRHTRSTLFPYTTLFRSQYSPSPGNVTVKVTIRRGADTIEIATITEPVGKSRDFGTLQAFERTEVLAFIVAAIAAMGTGMRSEEHTSELQSRENLVCRLL